jgi:hypothetical protein
MRLEMSSESIRGWGAPTTAMFCASFIGTPRLYGRLTTRLWDTTGKCYSSWCSLHCVIDDKYSCVTYSFQIVKVSLLRRSDVHEPYRWLHTDYYWSVQRSTGNVRLWSARLRRCYCFTEQFRRISWKQLGSGPNQLRANVYRWTIRVTVGTLHLSICTRLR